MGEKTGIQWTDHTFNPWWGCEKVSPACRHCYAETFSKRLGLPLWGGADTARRMASEKTWSEPVRWNRAAEKAGERHRVFCASMADVGEDRPDLVAPRARLAALVAATPALDWLLLTKRPENMVRLFPTWGTWPANVWAGTTAEDQEQADKRIPHLLAIPAAVRFLSVEPMLGAVNLERYMWPTHWDWDAEYRTPEEALAAGAHAAKRRQCLVSANATFVDWVILGGESGPKARPFDLDAARRVVADCKAAGVAVFVKQMGERWSRETGTHHLDAHGGDPQHWPAGDWPREFPKARAAKGA